MVAFAEGAAPGELWRRVVDVGHDAVPTEELRIPAACGVAPRLQVVVIPGNPGSCEYFAPFMREVYASLGGSADVLAVTHAGHCPDIDNSGQVWDLAQQVEHKLAWMREHVLLPGRPPVVLVGHSIGAAMAVQVVAALEGLPGAGQHPMACRVAGAAAAAAGAYGEGGKGQHTVRLNPLAFGPAAEAAFGGMDGGGGVPPILKVVAVFPFFETNFGGSVRQRRLRALAPWHEAMGWLGAAVTSLPMRLQMAFVHLNAALDPDAARLTARLLSRRTTRNAFYLAASEFRDLSTPWSWDVMQALGSRLHVMGCEADTWLSRKQFDDLQQRLPQGQASWHPDLRHAFCVSRAQSAAAAAFIADIARPCLLLHAPAAAAAAPRPTVSASPSAVSYSQGSSASTSSSSSLAPSASQQRRVHAAAADVEDTAATAAHAGATHAPHDDQLVPYGQTRRQQQQLYGDDVTGSTRHEAAAVHPQPVVVAAAMQRSGSGYSSGDVDGSGDQALAAGGHAHHHHHHRAPAAAGGAGADAGKDQQQQQQHASPVAIVASSRAAGGVMTRGMHRRMAAAGGQGGGAQ